MKRCAIYTRKSTEEGLDQEFNSLDAQREACEAYIKSQKAEGWVEVKTLYDDGGFTGANLERPALQKLLADIKQRKIDVIVVYKIDRLTRALMDFAKLVNVFDEYGVTFVSVTQAFNTTTSMGRLTLNVLLSFAQFEREVIAERVRDKIAASKQKGMWMGGTVPLGYRLDKRKLYPEEFEVPLVKQVFDGYLSCGSVIKLKQLLDQQQIKTKSGAIFSCGAIYTVLKNPVYIGKIRHKTNVYDGQQAAIIDDDLWQRVANRLAQGTVAYRSPERVRIPRLLKGKIFDQDGQKYTPHYTMRHNKHYCYYVSQNLLQHRQDPQHIMGRLPAQTLENAIIKEITAQIISSTALMRLCHLDDTDKFLQEKLVLKQPKLLPTDIIKQALTKVVVGHQVVDLVFDMQKLFDYIAPIIGIELPKTDMPRLTHQCAFALRRAEKGVLVLAPQDTNQQLAHKTALELKNMVRGIAWRNEFFNGTMMADIAKREKLHPRYVGRLIEASLTTQ